MASISKRTSGAWQNTSYGIRATATDTITTLPTTIYGDGTNATISIKGNTIQSGTPTLDNPIMPEGTGERTLNLSNVSDYTNDNTDTRTYFALRILMSKNGGQTETFSSSMQGTGEKSFTFTLTTEADTMRIVHNGSQWNLFIEELTGEFSGTYTYSFDLESNDPTTIGGLVLNDIMLNTGSTAKPFEPWGYKIPILSAGQTTPVYLGEVQTTRRIKKLVLDGTESVENVGSGDNYAYFRLQIGNLGYAVSDTVLSTHFRQVTITTQTTTIGCNIINSSSTQKCLVAFRPDNVATTSLTQFKQWLAAQYAAGTPVIVWYVLATEETAVVNEPLMKIDSYADEVNGISIPTTDGANTLSVDTTVQPSEVSVNYHGWHMGTVHERISGAWD